MKLIHTAFCLGLLSLASLTWAENEPDLVGTWQGPSTGHLLTEGFVDSVMMLEITEQQGAAFHGTKSWTSRESGETIAETFSGTVSPNGRVAIIDHNDGGAFWGEMMGDTMILQYLETGSDAKAYVVKLERQ